MVRRKAVNARVVVHRINASIARGEAAEVNPALHGLPALVQQLSSFCIECIEYGGMRPRASLFVREQVLFPFLFAVEM